MSMQDTLGDMLTRIRNAQMAKLIKVNVLVSKMNMSVLSVLKEEGYIHQYNLTSEVGKPYITVHLKYSVNGAPVIREIKRVSKPGKRVYGSIRRLPKHYNGLGVIVLSTSSGVKSDRSARLQNVGGEVICKVF